VKRHKVPLCGSDLTFPCVLNCAGFAIGIRPRYIFSRCEYGPERKDGAVLTFPFRLIFFVRTLLVFFPLPFRVLVRPGGSPRATTWRQLTCRGPFGAGLDLCVGFSPITIFARSSALYIGGYFGGGSGFSSVPRWAECFRVDSFFSR